MRRALALVFVTLFTLGTMMPISTDLTEAASAKIQRKRRKVKKYSRAWWRMYRARQRRAQAIAARRRELAEHREALATPAEKTGAEQALKSSNSKANSNKSSQAVAPVLGAENPNVAMAGNDVQFRVADQNGQQIGSAQLSVVGVAMPQNEQGVSERTRKQMLSGVPVSALRRMVIDRMVKENGWVVNDYQREIDGKKVFVIVAQSAVNGVTRSYQFYFTEVDGRIYNLATIAPSDYSDKAAADSEKLLRAMTNNNNRPTQTADLLK